MKKESMAVLKDRSVVFWFLNAGVCFGYSTKIEKEKREHAKQHGMIRTEISGAEIAEEMEKERRYFQLQMCEVGVRGGRARWAGSAHQRPRGQRRGAVDAVVHFLPLREP